MSTSASASASASASTSTNAPSISPSLLPSTTTNNASHSASQSTSASPTLPHSPETARQIAEARAALEASMQNIGASLDVTLKSRAQNLHSNSAQLEKQQKELVKETEKMRKETDKLKKVADEGARRVKELGNVQNWAEMLERDFLVLGETMRLVRQGDRGSGWDGNEDGWETSSGSESFSGSEDDDGEDHKTEATKDESIAGTGEQQKIVDGEGDIAMDGMEEHKEHDTTKGKEVEPVQLAEVAEGSSTTATIGSGSGSTAEVSSSSVHTATSTTS